jgi:PAS domain S-box-containing protein
MMHLFCLKLLLFNLSINCKLEQIKATMEYKNKLIDVLGNSNIGQVFYTFARYPDGRRCFLYISPNMSEYTDSSVDQMMADYKLAYRLVNPEQIQGMAEAQEESYNNLSLFYCELEINKENGRKYWININAIPERLDDGTVIWHGIQSDITEVKKQAKQVVKMNIDLKLLNAVNDVILKCNDKIELFQEICACMVETGKYRLAWIAKKPELDSVDQKVQALAINGANEYMSSINISLDHPEYRKGPTAQALLTKKTIITNNVNTNEYFKPWLEKARENNIAASAVFPFVVDDSVFALNVYSSNEDAFKDHEKNILERVAKNLALAVGRIRSNREKTKLNNLLRDRVKELKTISSIQEVFQTEYFIEDCLQRVCLLIPNGMQFPAWANCEIKYNGEVFSAGNSQAKLVSFSNQVDLANGLSVEIIVSYTGGSTGKDGLSFLPEEHELILTILRGVKLFANELLLIEDLKNTQSNLSAVFENTDVGYVLLDLKGIIISHNKWFLTMTKRLNKIDFRKGMNLLDALTNERYRIFKDSFADVLETKTARSYESVYQFEGVEEYVVLNIAPVFDHDELLNICVTIKDVTEIKRSEIESKRITNDLIIRNRDLEQFSFMVSHNLRAPVVNIVGLCSHLNDEMDDDEYKYIVESLSSSAERIVNVVDDLNTILMVKKDEHSMLEEVNLEKGLNDLVSYFNRVEDRRKPIIEFDVSAISILHTNASFIESILYNLIGNAIKYSKQDELPKINVWTEVQDHHALIHVRDNGIGIDINRHGQKLFKLYTQLNTDVKGKGLGLYMVKTQVQLLGGKVFVKSELGKGTEFIVSLPIREKNKD